MYKDFQVKDVKFNISLILYNLACFLITPPPKKKAWYLSDTFIELKAVWQQFCVQY